MGLLFRHSDRGKLKNQIPTTFHNRRKEYQLELIVFIPDKTNLHLNIMNKTKPILSLTQLSMLSLCLFLLILGGGCAHLSRQETIQLRELEAASVTIDHPVGYFERPNNPAAAALLNILPGFGNFYLAFGQGSDSTQAIYGAVNLLFWPLSILWGIPQAAIDANTLNERELLYYYLYDPQGKEDLNKAGITLDGVNN